MRLYANAMKVGIVTLITTAVMAGLLLAQQMPVGVNNPVQLWPAGQTPGVTNGSEACAGCVGEYKSSRVQVGSAVSLSLNVAKDITFLDLTAGDWDVRGQVITNPAGLTVTANQQAWLSQTSATVPALPNDGAYYFSGLSVAAGVSAAYPVGTLRILSPSPVRVYLSTQAAFSLGTLGAYGFMDARRMR